MNKKNILNELLSYFLTNYHKKNLFLNILYCIYIHKNEASNFNYGNKPFLDLYTCTYFTLSNRHTKLLREIFTHE